MSILSYIGEASKHFLSAVAAVSVLASGAWYIAEPRITTWVRETVIADSNTLGPLCTVIPTSGHLIEGGSPGTWGTVTWREVQKLRDNCGVPEITAVIVNGGGYYHDAPLSITGLPLPVGTSDISYRFFINERTEPGDARFRVIINFPEAAGGAPQVVSPWLPFTIEE